MKLLVLADEETVLAFRLLGIDGVVVDKNNALSTFRKVVKRSDVGVVIVTERVADSLGYEFQNLKMSGEFPLVLEIPDRLGPLEGKKSLEDYVRESIGIRI